MTGRERNKERERIDYNERSALSKWSVCERNARTARAQSQTRPVCAPLGPLFFMTPGNRRHMGDPDRVAGGGAAGRRGGRGVCFVGGTETQLAVTRSRAIPVGGLSFRIGR